MDIAAERRRLDWLKRVSLAQNGPRVEIVIPVFNGEKHLVECLESVIAQTYQNWSATILNNCSTDGTAAILDEFASRERRIRPIHCAEFVGQAANYNRAVGHASPDAAYIKILEADNWLTEDSIERMVNLAEHHHSVGIVSSYHLSGSNFGGDTIDYRVQSMSGQEAARHYFNGTYLMGAPTCLLFRASALRAQSPLFREGIFYDDIDLCMRIFREWGFGFIHQILSYTRHGGANDRVTRLQGHAAVPYILAVRHGTHFFSGSELNRIRSISMRNYYRALARAFVRGTSKRDLIAFHNATLAAEDLRINRLQFLGALASSSTDLLLNPKATIEGSMRILRRRTYWHRRK